jgi:hypothetical protein
MNDPFVHRDEQMIRMPDGYRLFTLEPDETPVRRGGRDDGPTQAKLKTALFVETYLTYCKLLVLDIRSAVIGHYTQTALKQNNQPRPTSREDDARAFIGPSVGPFSLDTCIEEGRKRAPAWFNKDAAALKTYMQTTQVEFARSALPDVSDVELAELELGKLKALAHAVNRAYELRDQRKAIVRAANRKRPQKKLVSLNPFPMDRYDFPGLEEAFLIAHHTGVDPTDLWFGWRRYSPFFKLMAYNGRDGRKVPLTADDKDDVAKMLRVMMPYLEGGKLPEDEVIWALLRLLGKTGAAHDSFEEKHGFKFAGPHGEVLS